MTSHSDQVEALLADYRRTREQLAEVHQALLAIKESVTNPDGLVTATVGPQGNLLGLVISDAAYQRYRAAELAQEIVRTTAAAAARAAERANATLRPVLPADSDPAALIAGRADLQPAEITPDEQNPPTPPRPSRPPREDDVDYEEQSWMDPVSGRGRRR
ncbi:MAG TPA: YbaB/EbfC family nucleoid-associated protein [Pseudonocardiaceae bacterium]|nr:YbaB/EbfC family nucleoid-associated protein [Pseudonocardiaceae bacterium]